MANSWKIDECLSCGGSSDSPSDSSEFEHLASANSSVFYGELVMIGYNGKLIQSPIEERRNKYKLYQRLVPNGVKVLTYLEEKSLTNNLLNNSSKSDEDTDDDFRTTTVPREQYATVKLFIDDKTDMFQLGRSIDHAIDFIVPDEAVRWKYNPSGKQICRTSSYACRIVVNRNASFTARIYSGGVDSSGNVKLGKRAFTFIDDDGETDHFTTYGTRIMHPIVSFCGGPHRGEWREVSFRGNIFPLRVIPSAPQGRAKLEDETNVLQDGTLIDLNGVTLLWRSAQGLKSSPSKEYLMMKLNELNARKVHIPSVRIPLTFSDPSICINGQTDIYVYFNCGHVQGYNWGIEANQSSNQCTLCGLVGGIARLDMGKELAFYVDFEPLTYAFVPCGHVASEKTVRYWASIFIPDELHAICPFCALPLTTYPGYVKLIFEEKTDYNVLCSF